MKLTERDKTLLFILGVLVVLCIPYFFVVRPLGEKKVQLQNEVNDLQERKDYLDDLVLRKEEFIAETKQAKEEEEKIISRFPEELSQEGSILFLHDTEERIPITLSQTAFEEETLMPLTNNAVTETGDAGSGAAAADGTAGTSATGNGAAAADSTAAGAGNNTAAGTGSADAGSGTAAPSMVGSCTQSQIIYSAGYESFKDFLAYILNNPDRMVISDLNAVYSGEMNIVTVIWY